MLIWIELNDEVFEDYSQLNQEKLDKRKRKNRLKIIMFLFSVVLTTMCIFSILNLSIDILFTFVSAISVPPISFIFPFMLYKALIAEGHL